MAVTKYISIVYSETHVYLTHTLQSKISLPLHRDRWNHLCREKYSAQNTTWTLTEVIYVLLSFSYSCWLQCVFFYLRLCAAACMHDEHASMHTCKHAYMHACIFAYISASLPLWHKYGISWGRGEGPYPSAWELGVKLYSHGPPNAKIRQTDSILWDTFFFTFWHRFLIHF